MMVFYEFLDFLKNNCIEENLSLDVKIYTSWHNNMLWCSSHTIFQMLLHNAIIFNTMSSTISPDLSELKVNLHTFSIFVIIEFNRLIKNMFDMLAIISGIKQTIAMTSWNIQWRINSTKQHCNYTIYVLIRQKLAPTCKVKKGNFGYRKIIGEAFSQLPPVPAALSVT